MEFENLLNQFQQNEALEIVAEQIQKNKTGNYFFKGLTGASPAFLVAALYKKLCHFQLVVLNDKEEAAYFHNNLQELLQPKEILFFPDSFKRPGKMNEISRHNILVRSETINKINTDPTKAGILVTYPEALIEKVVKPEVLSKHQIQIKMNGNFDADFLMDVLLQYGFERVDFVYEPGQFSIRGDIIDIFSYGNELPYRIELFGDIVESIRTFDVESQLSNKKMTQVSIIPNLQNQFKATEKTSLASILPTQSIIWFKDTQLIADVLLNTFDAAQLIFDTIKNAPPKNKEEIQHDFFNTHWEDTFENPLKIMSDFLPYPQISFTAHPQFETISWHTQPQPIFKKNFDLLIQNLKANQDHQITTYIFSDQAKQIERLLHILDDLQADVKFVPIYKGINEGFIFHDLKIACYTVHQIFDRFYKYKLKEGYSQSKAGLMRALKELQPGDFVTHIDFGVGIYSGLEKINVNGQIQESVRLVYRDQDLLYVGINSLHKISKYSGKEGTQPKINKLGTDAWEILKRKTKKQIKDIADQLIQLYAKRKAEKGFAFSPDNYLMNELEASFIYEDTPDQEKATLDFKKDMESDSPMDRLICGDVGFGKTEIAIRAAFKAVCDSKQVAVLVPTTILSMQHYRTFKSRMEDLPANLDYINRFKSASQKKETLKNVEEGKIDILIGTHALLSKQLKFKNLGLLIIDEEQKFGVSAKEKLRELKASVDTLTLTATPIPRTLQFSLMGARDLSVIRTPPPNRQPIETQLHPFNDTIIREAIEFEVHRGGQVFFVHNRVKDIFEIQGLLQKLCPKIDFGVAHGQLTGDKLEEAMLGFMDKTYDVLVCTNIVESGLDVPNANTIIINNAHFFGLSELHQLRGRVGRSNKKAFCYLLSPPLSVLSSDARKRLKTIEEFSDLGSGFQIAMRDMDIRGAGNLLGGEQSGFIAEIGFDMYHKILDEALLELKQSDYKDLYEEELSLQNNFVKDCQIDSDLEMLIPDFYIRNINERLSIYKELDHIENESALVQFAENLKDRFGPLPEQIVELFNALRLRWIAKKLGFERIIIKNQLLKCFFINNPKSYYYETPLFGKVISFVQTNGQRCIVKQNNENLILTIKHIPSMEKAFQFLTEMENSVIPMTSS